MRILQNLSETRGVSSPGHYCKRPAEGDRSAWIQASVELDHSGFDVSRLLFLLDLKLVESRRKISSADIDAVDGVFAIVFRD